MFSTWGNVCRHSHLHEGISWLHSCEDPRESIKPSLCAARVCEDVCDASHSPLYDLTTGHAFKEKMLSVNIYLEEVSATMNDVDVKRSLDVK